MTIGFIGLGKMGELMVSRLLEEGFGVVAYDLDEKAVARVKRKGAKAADSAADMANQLSTPRIVWMMVPHGDPVQQVTEDVLPELAKGDILIDGGNSFYEHSMDRAERAKAKGVYFMDVGVSGGLEGAADGSSLMIGGAKRGFTKAEPVFRALAEADGYEHLGPSGAGHFVKMVHNGIEYAMLQAYGEGYQVIEHAPFPVDLKKVTRVWRNGSVIRSWLLDLMQNALKNDPHLKKMSGVIGGGSTGRWTVKTAKKLKSPVPTVEHALKVRERSKKKPSFATKVVAALRYQFGGHVPPNRNKSK